MLLIHLLHLQIHFLITIVLKCYTNNQVLDQEDIELKLDHFGKKSQYDSNVGSLSLRFMKSNSPQLASVSYVPITLIDPVRVKFWFGSDYVILNAASVFGSANVGLRNSNTEVRINIKTNDI